MDIVLLVLEVLILYIELRLIIMFVLGGVRFIFIVLEKVLLVMLIVLMVVIVI